MTLLSVSIESFIQYVCAGKKNETPAAYRAKLRQLIAHLGDRAVESITANELDRFRVLLLTQPTKRRGTQVIAEPLTDWYIRGVLKTTKHFFRWLADTGRLAVNPAASLKVPPRSKPEPKAAAPEVIDKMYAAAHVVGAPWEQARNTALVQILRSTGVRIGGALATMVGAVDLAAGVIQTREKGNRVKKIYLNEVARADIRRWLDLRSFVEPRTDHLFVSVTGGGLTRSGAANVWERLAKAAGVEDQRHNFHAFRHAFAHDALQAGADLTHVSQLMGHSSIATTGDYYMQYTRDELQAIHLRVGPVAVDPAKPAVARPRPTVSLTPASASVLAVDGHTGPVTVLAIGALDQVAMARLIEAVRELKL